MSHSYFSCVRYFSTNSIDNDLATLEPRILDASLLRITEKRFDPRYKCMRNYLKNKILYRNSLKYIFDIWSQFVRKRWIYSNLSVRLDLSYF